jgi:hypothetical protein
MRPAVLREDVDFCGWLGLVSNRASEAPSGHGLLRVGFVAKSELLERSAAAARRAAANAPVRKQTKTGPAKP